jgi:hypothetical protein
MMALDFSPNTDRWPLDRLIPHVRDARTHSDAQVAQIAGSIAEFGFVNPILVGDDGVMVAQVTSRRGNQPTDKAAWTGSLHRQIGNPGWFVVSCRDSQYETLGVLPQIIPV